MGERLFETLAKHGIDSEESADARLPALSVMVIARLDSELYEVIRSMPMYKTPDNVGGFDFWPNSELAAYHGACAEASCRVERIDRLARFASMWADSVLVPSYFGVDHSNVEPFRNWMRGSIKLLFRLRPCMDAGIVRLSGDSYHVCPSCQLGVEPRMDSLRANLVEAQSKIKVSYKRKVAVKFETNNGRLFITRITGPEDLLPHGSFAFTSLPSEGPPSWIPEYVRTRAKAGEDLTYELRGRSVDQVMDHVLHPIVEDVVSQRLSAKAAGSKYLTNRQVDRIFLDAINEDEGFSHWNKVVAQYMEYEMPVLQGVPLEELVELRAKDYEAFQVYRDSIKRVIRDYVATRPKLTGREAQDVYNDVIAPQLHRMNQKLKTVRAKLSNKIRRDVAVATGVVALGLSSSLLAPELALTAAAGSPFLADATKQMLDRMGAKEELADDDMYFLWKIQAGSKYPSR